MTATCCLPEANVNSAFHEAVSVRISFLTSDIPSLSTFLTCPVRWASAPPGWLICLFSSRRHLISHTAGPDIPPDPDNYPETKISKGLRGVRWVAPALNSPDNSLSCFLPADIKKMMASVIRTELLRHATDTAGRQEALLQSVSKNFFMKSLQGNENF